MASLQRFVPATCPMKFNKLNSVRHVAGTKYPPNWCCIILKVSVYTRGHVAATYPWDMYPQHFHVCANVVILTLLHVPATRPCYMSPQCVLHKFFVAAACRCDMSLQHDSSCLPTFKLFKIIPPLYWVPCVLSGREQSEVLVENLQEIKTVERAVRENNIENNRSPS